jgi:hypothetical protein
MENTQNIFIVPTDKPSRLSILNSGKLNFGAEIMSSSNSNPQHIYITENTVVKEGEYGLAFAHGIRGFGRKRYVFKHDGSAKSKLTAISVGCQKIILASDPDLIKDNIQPIEDNFIEWFVAKANDSGKPIEIIEVKSMNILHTGETTFYKNIYEIVIPELELINCEHCGGDGIFIKSDSSRVECPACFKGKVEKEETKPILGVDYEYSIDENGMSVEIPIIKNETLQEGAENYFENNVFCDGVTEFEKQITISSFQAGGEYLAQKVIDFLNEEITERRGYSASKMCEVVREFIQEQIKNK